MPLLGCEPSLDGASLVTWQTILYQTFLTGVVAVCGAGQLLGTARTDLPLGQHQAICLGPGPAQYRQHSSGQDGPLLDLGHLHPHVFVGEGKGEGGCFLLPGGVWLHPRGRTRTDA